MYRKLIWVSRFTKVGSDLMFSVYVQRSIVEGNKQHLCCGWACWDAAVENQLHFKMHFKWQL